MKKILFGLLLAISAQCDAASTSTIHACLDKTVSVYVTATVKIVEIDISSDNVVTATEVIKTINIMGSGVFISKNGHVLTCAHLFRDDREIKEITIRDTDGYIYKAILLYVDSDKDLALLKTYAKPKSVGILRKALVVVGEPVIAVGNPLGQFDTVTVGIVGYGLRELPSGSYIQHQAFTNPGNSGGPLFDDCGNLLGINVRLLTPSRYETIFTGIGLAVPASDINRFLDIFRGI